MITSIKRQDLIRNSRDVSKNINLADKIRIAKIDNSLIASFSLNADKISNEIQSMYLNVNKERMVERTVYFLIKLHSRISNIKYDISAYIAHEIKRCTKCSKSFEIALNILPTLIDELSHDFIGGIIIDGDELNLSKNVKCDVRDISDLKINAPLRTLH